MLMPKKVKFRKQQRGRMTGKAWRGSELSFGDFGLKVMECGYITDRQIEAGRTVLSFVVTIGNEGRDAMGKNLIVTQHMGNDAIDRSVAATALLVGHAAGIPETGEDEAVHDMPDLVLIARQPGERADRAGNE